MPKENCWEFKKCGRESNGTNVHEKGLCPASTMTEADGFCEGKNGGRGCMYITGTFCTETIQGTYREKEKNCDKCEFYFKLKREHGTESTVLKFLDYIKEEH